MNAKRGAVLAVTFFILITLYFFIEKPGGNKAASPLLFQGFEKGSVAEILITYPEKDDFLLQKQNSDWKVMCKGVTYPGDAAPITLLLDTVADMQQGSIVSKNPKNFDPMEVTEEKGIDVRISNFSNKTIAHLLIGKNGPDLFTTYVRINNENRVLLVDGLLSPVFDKQLYDWRDKTIFSLNSADIREFRVDGEQTLVFKKDKKDTWQVLEPEVITANQETVKGAVTQFSKLDAVKFSEDNATKCGLDAPSTTITATLKNGGTETLLVGKSKNAFQHFVMVKGRDTIYVLEGYQLSMISPAVDSLKETSKKENNGVDNSL